MPSIPRFNTPARSQINSPNVAKINGVAILTTAAHKLVVNINSSNSNIIIYPKQFGIVPALIQLKPTIKI